MEIFKAGQYLKLLRLLNTLQQSEVAHYLKTNQGTLAQIEASRYNIPSFYAQTLADLFFLSLRFLSELMAPVFQKKVNVFRLISTEIPSTRMINQIDKTIREIFPALCVLERVDEIYAWTTGSIYEYSTKFSASLFLFYSSEFRQIILVKIRDDEKGPFMNGMLRAIEKMPIPCVVEDLSYGDFEQLFGAEFPSPDERQVEQFEELLKMTDIADQKEFVAEYSTCELNEIIYEKTAGQFESDYQRALGDAEDERLKILKVIDSLMGRHGISLEDISEYLKSRRTEPR